MSSCPLSLEIESETPITYIIRRSLSVTGYCEVLRATKCLSARATPSQPGRISIRFFGPLNGFGETAVGKTVLYSTGGLMSRARVNGRHGIEAPKESNLTSGQSTHARAHVT
jgi:hypothetical protein